MFKGRFPTYLSASLIGFVSLTVLAGVAQAASCTIAVAQGTPASRLTQLAKVSRVDAEKAALAHIKADRSTKVASSELEAEDGCLIWTFDLRVPGQPGITEIHVDAGDGKVLGVEHQK